MDGQMVCNEGNFKRETHKWGASTEKKQAKTFHPSPNWTLLRSGLKF